MELRAMPLHTIMLSSLTPLPVRNLQSTTSGLLDTSRRYPRSHGISVHACCVLLNIPCVYLPSRANLAAEDNTVVHGDQKDSTNGAGIQARGSKDRHGPVWAARVYTPKSVRGLLGYPEKTSPRHSFRQEVRSTSLGRELIREQ